MHAVALTNIIAKFLVLETKIFICCIWWWSQGNGGGGGGGGSKYLLQ